MGVLCPILLLVLGFVPVARLLAAGSPVVGSCASVATAGGGPQSGDPEATDTGLERAEAAFRARDFDAARTAFAACLESDPGSAQARLGLARCAAQERDKHEALRWLREVADAMGPDCAARLDSRRDLHPIRRDLEVEDFFWELRARSARRRMAASEEADLGIIWADGPRDFVDSITTSPEGGRLLSVGLDHLAHLWDRRTGELIATLDGHQQLTQVQFSPDGNSIATRGARDGRVSLWDGSTGSLDQRLDPDDHVFTHVAFSPDSLWIVTTRTDGLVQVWPTAAPRTGAPAPECQWQGPAGARRAEFSPASSRRLVAGFQDGTVLLLDRQQCEVVRQVPGDRGAPLDLVFSPKGQHFAVACVDGTVEVFDAEGRESLRLVGHEGAVWQVLFHPGGHRLATISPIPDEYSRYGLQLERFRHVSEQHPPPPSGDGTVRLWSLETGQALRVLGESAERAAFDPTGRSLATVHRSGDVHLTEGADGAPAGVLQNTLRPHALSFSLDGQWLAVAGDPSTNIWSLEDRDGPPVREPAGRDVLMEPGRVTIATAGGTLVRQGAGFEDTRWFGPHLRRPLACLWTGRDAELAVLFADDLRFWDARTGESTRPVLPLPLPDAEAASVGRDGSILVASQRGNVLISATGELLWTRPRSMAIPTGFRSEIAHSATGDRVAVTQQDGIEVFDTEDGRQVQLVDLPAGHVARFVQWTEGELWYATGRSQGLLTRVLGWEMPSGHLLHDLPFEEGFVNLRVHDASGLLVIAGADHSVRCFDLEGAPVGRPMIGHSNWVSGLVFGPEGRRLLSFGQDNAGRLWDVETGDCLARMPAERFLLFGGFSASGDRIVLAGLDGLVRLYDGATGEAIGEPLRGHAGVHPGGQLHPGQDLLATPGGEGTVRVWDVAGGRLVMTRAHYGPCEPPDHRTADPSLPVPDQWLCLDSTLTYRATERADDLASVRDRSGRVHPLSCYARLYSADAPLARGETPSWSRQRSEPPEVSLDERGPVIEVEDRRYRFRASVKDLYLTEEPLALSITVNGRVVPRERIQVEAYGRAERRVEFMAYVPGDSNVARIEMQVENSRGILSRRHTLEVRYRPAHRDLYLVAFGMDTYDDPSLNLKSPVKDVDAIIARFQAQQGVYYNDVHVMRDVNEELSRGDADRALHQFLGAAGPEDMILVFVAGHAVRAANGAYYFLTKGCTPADPYDGITRDQLYQLVRSEELKPRRRVMLLDTCVAGFGRGVSISDSNELLSDILTDSLGGTYVIAASRRFEAAFETGENGLFTAALLEGLDGAGDEDGNGFLTIEEWYGFAKDRVRELSGNRQQVNYPMVAGGGDDFAVARVRQP